MLKSSNIKKTGFTLIELLIALAVFAYTATAIVKLVGSTANNLSQLEEMTFASWIANNRLAELQASTVWPPKNKEKGEVTMVGKTWYWRQDVVETEDKKLRSVTVLVGLEKELNYPVYDLTTFLSQNTATDEALN